MGVLENPRHERFAQELAKGKTATEAYVLAGYKDNDGNASTLKGNQRILDRVAEIQTKGAERAEITAATIVENLRRIADKAEAKDDSPGLSVSRAAWMDVAKVSGLIIERKEVRTGALDELDPDELAKLRTELDAGEAAAAEAAGGPGNSSKPH